MKIGDRVKRVRRGCEPTYGTVLEVVNLASEPGEQWLKIDWDHSGISHAMRSELVRARVDRFTRPGADRERR